MAAAKIPDLSQPIGTLQTDTMLLVGYFCFCGGLILGASLVKKNQDKLRRESSAWEASGKERLEEFEAERKKIEADWIVKVSDAVSDAVVSKLSPPAPPS